MAVLRSLLELYGALDHALIQSDDPKVHEHVDNLLPGASANKGWYDELHGFLSNGRTAPPSDISDPSEAIKKIAEHKEPKLTTPQKSRLFFGIAAHAGLRNVAPKNALRHLTKPEFTDALAMGLNVVGPGSTPYDQLSATDQQDLHSHVDAIGDEFKQRHQYAKICADGKNDFLDPAVADVGLCHTSIVTVDGIQCVVIDTDIESKTISLQRLKAIVDPRNWHKDYHEFFLNMEPFGPRRRDEWGRVRETVGLADDVLIRQLVTALKYYKSEDEDKNTARVEYDLDDPTPSQGDGQVLVDRGFINMRATGSGPAQKGVHVRTRKVVHIRGLEPYTQQRLVCVTGYGTASKDFLFGAAEEPKPGVVPWHKPATALDPPKRRTPQPAPVPGKPTSHVAQAVATVLSDCVEDLANQNLAVLEKWTTGTLDFTGLANYSKDVSGRLMSTPWEFLQALNDPWSQPAETQKTKDNAS
jgi:hypothetical protein